MTWGEEKIRAECARIKQARRDNVPTYAHVPWIMHFGAGMGFPDRLRNAHGKERDKHQLPLMLACMGALRSMNFWVAHDRETRRRHRIISDNYYMGGHLTGRLRFRAEYFPIGMKVDFYPDGNICNPNGPRYAMSDGKCKAMDPRTHLVYRAAIRKLVTVAQSFGCVDVGEPELDDPRDKVAWQYWSDRHWDGRVVPKFIDDPAPANSHWQDKDRDGRVMRNGDRKFFRDRRGLLWCGRVYYAMNDNWYVVCGGSMKRATSGAFFDPRPGEPRRAPTDHAVSRTKTLIDKAAKAEDFELAALLRDHRKLLEAGGAAARSAW